MDELAKHMADVIGHGMSEKCERHAEIAEEFYSERIQELEGLAQQVIDIKNPKDVMKARNKAMLLLTNHKEVNEK